MKKIKTSKASWLVIGVLGIFAIGGFVLAAGNSITNNFYDNSTADQRDASQPNFDLGGVTVEDEFFTANVSIEETLTRQDVTLGTRFSLSLDLSATSTSPGAVGSLTNSIGDRICSLVELDITTASTAGGRDAGGSPFSLSVTTSTAVGIGNGANLIATSTIATSTTPLFDGVVDKGTGIATAGQSWEWSLGEVIQVSFDGTTTDPATSTSALPGADAGKLYVTCHTK